MKQKGERSESPEARKLREKLLRFNKHLAFFERDGDFKYPGSLERDQKRDGKPRQELIDKTYFIDPYRDHETLFYKKFFDERGYLTSEAKEFLKEFISWPGIKPMCDAVKMLVADRFAGNTKGNYSTIYFWRD